MRSALDAEPLTFSTSLVNASLSKIFTNSVIGSTSPAPTWVSTSFWIFFSYSLKSTASPYRRRTEVRKFIKNCKSDLNFSILSRGVDFKEYEKKIQKLVDTHVGAG